MAICISGESLIWTLNNNKYDMALNILERLEPSELSKADEKG